MGKDERLYARFDIAMDEHPKIMLLSDLAFRALFESTMYARRQLTDGFLPAGVVLKKWGREVADELTANHPERPSWVVVDGGWQIRDYAEHQITRADIEAKREAGRKGGLAKAGKYVAPASEVLQQNAGTTLAMRETEKETKTTTPKGVVRATRLPPSWSPSAACVKYAHENRVDLVHEMEQFKAHADANGRTQKNWDAAFRQWLGNAKKWTKESGKAAIVVPPKMNGLCVHRFVGGWCAECSEREPT